jgi:hypothetical protein
MVDRGSAGGEVQATMTNAADIAYNDGLVRYWDVLCQLKWRVAGLLLVSTAVAVAVSFLIRPTFRAEILLSPATQEAAGGGGIGDLLSRYSDVASLAGVIAECVSGSAEAVATLTSRALLRGSSPTTNCRSYSRISGMLSHS